jgi:TnsA endonuclease N terminal
VRKTKRFTPSVLSRFAKQGRGQGTYGDYVPWHCVTRGDPSSSGRSHLMMWRDRLRELLSDGELGSQFFATMLPDIDDCLEQFDLDTGDGPHVLSRYHDRDPLKFYPGTIQLAKQLGIKHPMVRDESESALWRPTTDLLLIRKDGARKRFVQAIAFKPDDCIESRRTRELLSLEREFWTVRSVQWLLITPKLHDRRVVLTLRRIGAWALAEPATQDAKQTVVGLARDLPGRTVDRVLGQASSILGSVDLAQRALWQSVWFGDLPIDLRRGWRPQEPLRIVSSEAFAEQNPIASGRSSWTS